jgi:hypothetical protein
MSKNRQNPAQKSVTKGFCENIQVLRRLLYEQTAGISGSFWRYINALAASSIATFERHLKSHLFKSAFSLC